MVQKYDQFINESKNNGKTLTYSVITALAVFKPEFFDFLNSMKNRYYLTDNSFWQGLILEIKKTPEIKLEKQHLLDIKGISVENDWSKLKKCFIAGQKIKTIFPEVKVIKVTNDSSLIVDGNIIRGKKDEDKLNVADIEKYLGFTGRTIYNHDLWKYMISHWIELMKKYLNGDSLKYYNYFIDKIEENKLDLNWNNFKNFRVKGLGIRIDSLPKLYYSSFYDLNIALSTNETYFTDYNAFVIDWLNFKNDILNKKILYPLIKENKNRIESAQEMLVKFYSLEDRKYFRFDNKLDLLEIPSKEDFKVKTHDINIKETFLTNNRKDLIVEIKSDKLSLKVMIAMKGLCPSLITIKSKYDEENGSKEMGKL